MNGASRKFPNRRDFVTGNRGDTKTSSLAASSLLVSKVHSTTTFTNLVVGSTLQLENASSSVLDRDGLALAADDSRGRLLGSAGWSV